MFLDFQHTDDSKPFLSKSLFIVLDDFERIIYIDRKLFFIIIQLLNTVACVASSNLLVFFYESNTSSCRFATASYLNTQQ